MGRARIRRAAKPKPAPITYLISDEIGSVAATLYGRFDVHFRDIRQLSIAFVMISGGREPSRDRIDGVWARFMKQTDLQKSLHGYDAVVWVREAIWKILEPKQREALIAHELSHGMVNEKGVLVVQRHDLEDFAWVARNFGAWHDGVELYGKQLSLFGSPDKPVANGQDVHEDAFAEIDAQVAQRKAEAEEPTPIRPRTTTDQPGAVS